MTMRRGWASLVVAGAMGLWACGGADGDGEWRGTMADSAGIPLVENPEEGLWSDGDAWQLEEVFRVGGMDADTAYQFGNVGGVDVTEDGRVLAADQQVRTVRVFDSDGTLVARMGSPGAGPGEFGPAIMGVFEHEGQALVPDMTQGRLQRFDLDGTFVESIPNDPTRGIPFRFDEDGSGRVVIQRRSMTMVDGAPVIGGDGDVLVALDAMGTRADTLYTLPMGEGFSMTGTNPEFVAFNPEPVWDVSESGAVAVAMNDVYRVHVIEDGQLARIVSLPREPVPVTEMEEQRVRQVMREMMEQYGAPGPNVDAFLQMLQFAESYPVLSQVLLASDGSLWVQRIRTARDVPEGVDWDIQDLGSNEWDVFDADGLYLGVMTLPLRFQPFREIDGVLWGIDRDELDVQSVVGLRIVKGE